MSGATSGAYARAAPGKADAAHRALADGLGPGPLLRSATATVAGHFGEFLQGRQGASGPVVLVTLPCPALAARATWRFERAFAYAPGPGSPLSRRRAAMLMRALTGSLGGRLRLSWTMKPGGGMGSSTAALVATAHAVAAALGRPPPPAADLGLLCAGIEGATDPLMLDRPAAAIWASREGRIVGSTIAPPAFDVAGTLLGVPERTDSTDSNFANVADLVTAWTSAAVRGDRRTLAEIATESARRNAAHRGGAPLGPILDAATRTGALGVAIGHTGPARALLYAPGDGDPSAGARALRALGGVSVICFRTPRP
ncbi:propanediol utilization protein [Rubrimonas cliftonensis]|uniref:Threonine kinase n=1 Tax=Rubrimonas cliftonensis TaxID=89524 RepID=A0A1H4FWR9_9RHOB|nr:propanediol utilization protein [Rubrimonas cliftonensis]SEB01789.1 threonine kinase [Rubrimonas cliftonensis]